MNRAPPTCPVCDGPLSTASHGLCPRCTWQQTLSSDASLPDPPVDADPEWLAAHGVDQAGNVRPTQRRFADYELGEELGRGGMGVVYAAVQLGAHRRVALKILSPAVTGASADARRFRNEVEAASRLEHPNILPLYQFGEQDGQLFYTMKLAEGGTLAERALEFGERGSGSDVAQQRRIAMLLLKRARPLAFAHQHGILHRDLKPANILLDAEGEVYISDFGLAKFLDEDRGLTFTQGIVGTPGYMAPEQAEGRKHAVTTATDVYGLGAVLYELLTGRAPFGGDSTIEIVRKVVDEEVAPPHQLRPGVDRGLESICLKCVAKEPSRRYPTTDALARDLSCWLKGETISARRASTHERAWRWCRRRPALAASSMAVAVLALVSTVAAIRMGLAIREANRESYYANISLAYNHVQEGEIQEAKTLLLEGCPEEHRHWEWGHLMYLCHQSIAFLPLRTNITALDDARFDFMDKRAQGMACSSVPTEADSAPTERRVARGSGTRKPARNCLPCRRAFTRRPSAPTTAR